MTTIHRCSSYAVCLTTPAFVFIIDRDMPGYMSVTNDAENVCRDLYSEYGDRRFIYRDSTGRWDELAHHHGTFQHFSPLPECFVAAFDVPK